MSTATFGDERLPERFWSKVYPEPNTGCWLWGRAHDDLGYGRYRHEGEARNSHRVVMEMLAGPIPAGLWVDHLCRFPPCCNPEHLELVTPYENRIRGEQGQFGALREVCARGHALVGENVVQSYKGYDTCRTCRNDDARIRMRKVNARKRAALVSA